MGQQEYKWRSDNELPVCTQSPDNALRICATSRHLAVGRRLRPTALGAPGLAPLRVRQLKLLAPALVSQSHDL